MKSSDFRKGNLILVSFPGEEVRIPNAKVKVQGITLFGEILCCNTPQVNGFAIGAKYCAGVPISEDELVGLGFNRKYVNDKPVWVTDHYMFNDGIFYVKLKNKGFASFIAFNSFLKDIKYVHELQNLYYSLTEEEVGVK